MTLTSVFILVAFIFAIISVVQSPRSLLAWAVTLIAAALLFPVLR